MRTQAQRSTMTIRLFPALALAVGICGCGTMSGRYNNQIGMMKYRQGNLMAAQADFQRAAIDDPDNAAYQHNLAATQTRQGHIGAAEQTYRHALYLDPAHQPSYHNLAQLMSQQGRTAEASELLHTWAGTEPHKPEPYVELAWLQRQTGNLPAAESTLQQALQMEPSNSYALAHLGQVYQDTGRTQLASAMYQRSLRKNWNQPLVRTRLASIRSTQPFYSSRGTAIAQYPAAHGASATAGMYSPGPVYATAQPTFAPVPDPVSAQPVQPQPQPVPFNADPAHVAQATPSGGAN